MKLGTVGVNLGNVEAYRTALKGLSIEQSVFALASKGATEEQIRQILVTDQAKLKDVEAAMAKAGLTTATKALNAEELIALATEKGISAERAKEIASALGLIATEKGQVVSKKQLTVATLQQVGATDAEITAILGLNAAETANIGITNVLTASFAKLWAVITAHPIGAILTAIGVVAVGAVAAYNKWGDTLENTKEKLSDLKSECQEIVSDLQAVNSELETTQQRLEELEGKDTLTFTEKEEYDNLVKINNELQRKIDLLELEEKNKRKEQNKTFVSAMEKDTENPFEHEVNPDGKKPAGQYSISDEYLTSETGYINAQFEIREQLLDDLANAETEKEKERIQKRIDEINSYLEDKNTEWKTVSDGIDYIENPTTEDDKAVNEWLDYIADFQDRMAIVMGGDNAKTNTFNRLVDNWQFDEIVQGLQDLGTQGKVTAEMLNDPKYDKFINKLVELGVIDSADNLNDIAKAFNGLYSDSYQNLIDLFGQDAVDKLTPEDLEIAYTISSEEADKTLEQEKNKIKSELESLSKEGNVDLTIRPVIDSSAMQAAGWDVEDGSIATTFTQGEFIWQGDEENGQYVYVHYTPILPDGTVLTPDELTDYLYGTLEGSQSVLDADNKGIVLKVDTDLNIPEGDIKKFTNGEGSTEAIDGLIQKTGEWDDKVHSVQEQYYDTGESVNYASNALDGLIEKHKQLENPDEITDSSIIKAWKSVGDINDSSIAETKEQLLELAESGNLTVEAFKDSSIAEEFLKETGLSAEEAIEKINKLIEKLKELDPSKSAITSLSDAKSAFSNFNSIYDEMMGGQTVSADSINSLEQSFGTVDTGLALENFRNILATTDDIDAQKQALDDLATAYLDNSRLLDGMTEETKDYVKAELKKIGVTNADEFVENRLNDTTKQLLKNLKQFSTVFAKNSNALKNSSKGTVEYNDALSEIKDGLSELFSYEIDGELFTFDIPDDFVAENIEEIEKAASGSVDALYRLKAELAKEYVANVELNVPESAVGGLRQQINGWINEINIDDIEVGTSLNDTPLIQGLNNLVDAGIMTRNNMNNILASIGVTPEITYENAQIEIPNISSKSPFGGAADVALAGLKAAVRVPKIDYKVGSKATSANYASPSGGSSGTGGGGGGGSSSAEETTETFDWIETAITRTQESAERLDKTVGNVYETWSNRNKALASEINKVKDELVLQQQAYDAYMKKANSVGLSEDYKKKIQSGALQIEDIKDEKLREKISQYQEWYEKATECKDAIQDLNISLGDLAEQKFDNIEKEFSDLISLIEGQADIIEERINRTEEQGYFASANYYKQQLQYESQEMDKLKKQYTELITQRDSAVLNGYIEEGSEAYNDMTKAILDVQQAMEESATATVELNNAIRDLNWEIFDYIEERIGKIAEESNFLIDLLDNQSLYNENGSFNERGQSAVYLHGQNVKVYTQQAKDYANELKKINSDLAKDPSNKTLIERREELLDLQQESISNIYAEKEAVKSLVEEGVNLHLEKLTELIDKYKESMNSAKD